MANIKIIIEPWFARATWKIPRLGRFILPGRAASSCLLQRGLPNSRPSNQKSRGTLEARARGQGSQSPEPLASYSEAFLKAQEFEDSGMMAI